MFVITAHSKEFEPLHNITYPSKEAYALRHRISKRVYLHKLPRIASWERVVFWRDALEDCDDFIFFTGTDVAITNGQVDPYRYITDDADFIVGCDGQGLQCDVFWMRRTSATLRYLDDVLQMRGKKMNEQMALQLVASGFDDYFYLDTTLRANYPDLTTGCNALYNKYPGLRVRVYPASEFNCYPLELYPPFQDQDNPWQPGCFIMHMPGQPMDVRLREFPKYLAK